MAPDDRDRRHATRLARACLRIAAGARVSPDARAALARIGAEFARLAAVPNGAYVADRGILWTDRVHATIALLLAECRFLSIRDRRLDALLQPYKSVTDGVSKAD